MKNKNNKFKKIISRFSGRKILVIGDVMLDEFLWGKVSRISPEAPVPVVWIEKESFMPGGSANVTNNISSFGAKSFIIGVVGLDDRGRILRSKLEEKGVNIEGIILDEDRPTTLKTRVIAHHQQVVRIDKEKKDILNEKKIEEIINYVKRNIKNIDAVIIEDYGKGVITPLILKEVIKLAKKYKKIVVVDPKEEHFSYYKGVTAITPNHHEASFATGVRGEDKEAFNKMGKLLLKKLKVEAALITLGDKGMQLFEKNGRVTHIPTFAQEVFDVSGAGDTVIAVFTLALSSGASLKEAAYIANVAAGIVVGKVGIATVTKEELLKHIK